MLEELETLAVETDVECGLLAEYSGDFEVVSGGSDGADSYRQALDYYSSYEEDNGIDERIGQMSEPPFQENTELLRELTTAAQMSIHEENATEIEYHSPVARIQFKQDRFPDVIESVAERQQWL
ncbi:hypothetical protein [Halosimplex amylolyticum]|uniref:hypothetical protein n=1 Tax=Halosimplex amylolyticum TaxID=3396616 RepID=UPI003F575741